MSFRPPARALANTLKKTLTLSLVIQAVIAPGLPAWAAGKGDLFKTAEELDGSVKGNEYISGNYAGAVLMPVRIWGAVPKAGIHHVPTQTDLLTLLTYAGGPSPTAELKELLLRRSNGEATQVMEINLKKFMADPSRKPLALEPNDIIYIPSREDDISNNTMKTLTFISVSLAAILSAWAISDRLR